MPVVIVTDSSASLPSHLRERFDIRQVPLHLTVDGQDYREGVDEIGPEHFLAPGASTAGATPADVAEAFGRAVEDSKGDGVVAVHLSRRMSGTWSTARLAADAFPGLVRVVDSKSVGFGVGFPVLAAAQEAAAGADRDRAYEAAVRATSTTEVNVCLSSLDRLRQSGRIGTAAGLLGSALSIKPLLRIVDGTLVLREKQRTLTRALDRAVAAAVAAVGDKPCVVGIQHCEAAGLAREVEAKLRAALPTVTGLLVAPIGAVLASHVGSGSVAIVTATGVDGSDLD